MIGADRVERDLFGFRVLEAKALNSTATPLIACPVCGRRGYHLKGCTQRRRVPRVIVAARTVRDLAVASMIELDFAWRYVIEIVEKARRRTR